MKNNMVQFRITFLFGIILCLSFKGIAQSLTADGNTHTISYSGDYVDYVVPSTFTYQSLFVKALGGDGGDATNNSPDGGRGAQIEGYLIVSSGDSLRFIVGGKGESKGDYGGGGGGTAIAVKKKGENNWQLVLVAGGGGGAGLDRDGREGTTSTSGSNGIRTNDLFQDGHVYNAGTNGNGGGDSDGGSGGGKSTAGDGGYGETYGGQAGYSNNMPTGGFGGSGGQNQVGGAAWAIGGWGFGGGGAAYRPDTDIHAGGGGGGYSGGGGGETEGGGGGGGSYSNSAFLFNPTQTSRGSGNSPTDGFAIYKFTNEHIVGNNYAASETGEKQVGSIRPFIHQDLCIDNTGGKTTNRNKIQLWNCGGAEGNNNQKWFFDGDFIRLSNHRGKCLDLPGDNSSNGTDLQLYTCTEGATSQQWIYDQPTHTIRLKRDISKCIDLTNGSTTNGTVVQIWDCQTNNSNMQWILEEATPNPEDEVFGAIKLTSNTNNCIDLKSGNISNGANIQLWPCNGTIAQTWYVEGDQIRIDGRDNYCLSLASGDAHNGDEVHIWECKDQENQAWIFDMTFKLIRSRIDANKCLTVVNDDIKLATCSFDSSTLPYQQWTLPGGYSERVNGKNLKIHLGKDDNKCIDMASASSGADVRVYDCNNGSAAAAQTFYFDGSRIRRADNHYLCLELEGAKTDVGTDIQLGTCTGSIFSQKWMYDGISGRIHSKADPNKCMDFDHAYTANGTNLKLDDCKVHDAQIFDIK